jgi:ADP-ribose pyrophosphatase
MTDSKWLNLFEVDYIGKHGDHRSWLLASRKPEPKCATGDVARPDAVVIVPYHVVEKRWVMIREYRVPLADYEYGFPAGLVDGDETIETAARRELKEETGLTIRRFSGISPPVYSSAGMTDESVSMVFVDCDGEISTAATGDSELIRVLLITGAEAGRLYRRQDVKFDAKAWLVLMKLADDGF